MKVYDISPILSEKTGVFPGDLKFSRSVSLSFEAGHHLTLSSIQTTLHVGAHADAPIHYASDGFGIDRVPLSAYVGPVYVCRTRVKRGDRIELSDLSPMTIEALSAPTSDQISKRVLFHTGSFPDPDNWNSDFSSISAELIDWLADRDVVLIGIDTPSIDPETSKALEAHSRVAARGLAILEGLCLESVPEGLYFLVAAPIRMKDADSGLVRPLLFDFSSPLLKHNSFEFIAGASDPLI